MSVQAGRTPAHDTWLLLAADRVDTIATGAINGLEKARAGVGKSDADNEFWKKILANTRDFVRKETIIQVSKEGAHRITISSTVVLL